MCFVNSLIIGIFAISACVAQSTTYSVIVKDIDGNLYTTVKIGSQVWTVENLRTTRYNDSTKIPYIKDSASWMNLAAPGFCWYQNSTKNKSTYGALYNWYAVDAKKIAPKGWHVPSKTEWAVLENWLIAKGYNWDGATSHNMIAKALSAQTNWSISPQPGTIGYNSLRNNRSCFSALPGGCRLNTGNFINIGQIGHWWSVSESNALCAHYRFLTYKSESFEGADYAKKCGMSVRLVKD
jgi:uncharacterized protein (TIGR02145 family)